MTRGFLLLDSFIEAIDQLPADRQWPFLKALFDYRMEGKEPELDSPLERMAFTVIKRSIDASAERYEKAVEDGQKGGRPKRWIEREEAEEAYARLKSWDAVAKELDVSKETLRKARIKWAEYDKNPDAQKPKNHTKNKNKTTTDNKTMTKTYYQSVDKENQKEKTASPPPAPDGASAPLPLMPGYEFDRPDGRYRINEEGRAIRIADKPK